MLQLYVTIWDPAHKSNQLGQTFLISCKSQRYHVQIVETWKIKWTKWVKLLMTAAYVWINPVHLLQICINYANEAYSNSLKGLICDLKWHQSERNTRCKAITTNLKKAVLLNFMEIQIVSNMQIISLNMHNLKLYSAEMNSADKIQNKNQLEAV